MCCYIIRENEDMSHQLQYTFWYEEVELFHSIIFLSGLLDIFS